MSTYRLLCRTCLKAESICLEYELLQDKRPKFIKSRKFTPFSGGRSLNFAHAFLTCVPQPTRYRTDLFPLPDILSPIFGEVSPKYIYNIYILILQVIQVNELLILGP